MSRRLVPGRQLLCQRSREPPETSAVAHVFAGTGSRLRDLRLELLFCLFDRHVYLMSVRVQNRLDTTVSEDLELAAPGVDTSKPWYPTLHNFDNARVDLTIFRRRGPVEIVLRRCR